MFNPVYPFTFHQCYLVCHLCPQVFIYFGHYPLSLNFILTDYLLFLFLFSMLVLYYILKPF